MGLSVGPDALVRVGEPGSPWNLETLAVCGSGLQIPAFADTGNNCGAGAPLGGRGIRPYASRDDYLLCRFFFDDHLQVRGHVLVQFDGDGELAHGLERLVDLDLAAIHVEAFLRQRVRDIAGRD